MRAISPHPATSVFTWADRRQFADVAFGRAVIKLPNEQWRKVVVFLSSHGFSIFVFLLTGRYALANPE
jgi:hypothetical protein